MLINSNDFHTETAAEMFGIDSKYVTPAQRNEAKAATHKANYTPGAKLPGRAADRLHTLAIAASEY